jgi:Sel1 repeat
MSKPRILFVLCMVAVSLLLGIGSRDAAAKSLAICGPLSAAIKLTTTTTSDLRRMRGDTRYRSCNEELARIDDLLRPQPQITPKVATKLSKNSPNAQPKALPDRLAYENIGRLRGNRAKCDAATAFPGNFPDSPYIQRVREIATATCPRPAAHQQPNPTPIPKAVAIVPETRLVPTVQQSTQRVGSRIIVGNQRGDIKDLNTALQQVTAGGRIELRSGSYQGPFIINKSVTIIGIGPTKPVLNVSSGSYHTLAQEIPASESLQVVRLENLRIENAGTGYAVRLTSGTLEIAKSEIAALGRQGTENSDHLAVSAEGGRISLKNNDIRSTDVSIRIISSPSTISGSRDLVQLNRIVGNIQVFGGADPIVESNLVSASRAKYIGLFIAGTAKGIYKNNLFAQKASIPGDGPFVPSESPFPTVYVSQNASPTMLANTIIAGNGGGLHVTDTASGRYEWTQIACAVSSVRPSLTLGKDSKPFIFVVLTKGCRDLTPAINEQAVGATAQDVRAYDFNQQDILTRLVQRIDASVQIERQSESTYLAKWGLINSDFYNDAPMNPVFNREGLGNKLAGLQAAANENDPAANYILGTMALYGYSAVPADATIASRYLHQSAIDGSSHSAYIIGTLFRYGWAGLTVNVNESDRWFRIASDRGSVIGKMALAASLDAGAERSTRAPEIFRLYSEAANGNNQYAQLRLAYCYQTGFGTVSDRGKAREWANRAKLGPIAKDSIAAQALLDSLPSN